MRQKVSKASLKRQVPRSRLSSVILFKRRRPYCCKIGRRPQANFIITHPGCGLVYILITKKLGIPIQRHIYFKSYEEVLLCQDKTE